jgi:hypothetical protein
MTTTIADRAGAAQVQVAARTRAAYFAVLRTDAALWELFSQSPEDLDHGVTPMDLAIETCGDEVEIRD